MNYNDPDILFKKICAERFSFDEKLKFLKFAFTTLSDEFRFLDSWKFISTMKEIHDELDKFEKVNDE